MGKISDELEQQLGEIGNKNKKAISKVPIISGFLADTVRVFELILDAITKLEDKIDRIEKNNKGVGKKGGGYL